MLRLIWFSRSNGQRARAAGLQRARISHCCLSQTHAKEINSEHLIKAKDCRALGASWRVGPTIERFAFSKIALSVPPSFPGRAFLSGALNFYWNLLRPVGSLLSLRD